MRVLIACEESQAVVKEFRRLGHEAYSCDIEECSGGHPEIHLSMAEVPGLEPACPGCSSVMGKLMEQDPAITAVVALRDMLALGVYCYAAEHHLKIPDDLAVIGFDNEIFSQALTPQLTTLSENAPDSAECLFRIIQDLLLDRHPEQTHLIDPLLLVRGSTGKHRGDPN